MSFKILGTGRYLPENVVTNDDLAKFLDTSDEWITERTGIKERRVSINETTTDLAVGAALAALENAGVDASELFDALTDEDGKFDPDSLADLIPEDVDITKTMEAIMQMQIKAAVESQLDLQDAIVELDNAFDDIEPYRIVVSTLAMIILIGCACLFIIILVSINKNGSSLGLPHIGFASVLSGLVFLILSKGPSYIPEHLFAEYHIPESTFALITSSLLTVFGTVGTIVAIVGAIIFVLGILLGAARR